MQSKQLGGAIAKMIMAGIDVEYLQIMFSVDVERDVELVDGGGCKQLEPLRTSIHLTREDLGSEDLVKIVDEKVAAAMATLRAFREQALGLSMSAPPFGNPQYQQYQQYQQYNNRCNNQLYQQYSNQQYQQLGGTYGSSPFYPNPNGYSPYDYSFGTNSSGGYSCSPDYTTGVMNVSNNVVEFACPAPAGPFQRVLTFIAGRKK